MARGSQQATQAATSAQGLSNNLSTNAQNVYSTLMPELVTEATHPAGLTPTEQADMLTSAQQEAGGTQAAAKGEGALLASRTKNPGAAGAGVAEASRQAGKALAKSALGVKLADASLKEKQREGGISGLEGLNSTETGASIGALGIVPQAVNANTNAANASWDWSKYILDPVLSAAGGAAGSYLGK